MCRKVDSDLLYIRNLLEEHRAATGSYPESLNDPTFVAIAPKRADLSLDLPLDAWDRPYVYVAPCSSTQGLGFVTTLGSDGKVGGFGDDEDAVILIGEVSK